MSERRCRTKISRVSITEPVLTRCYDLLSVEHVVITPILADGKRLAQATILVSLGEKPWGVHEIFPWRNASFRRLIGWHASRQTLEVLGNLLVPQGDVGFTIVNDGSQLLIPG